jgi:hypothetical protein
VLTDDEFRRTSVVTSRIPDSGFYAVSMGIRTATTPPHDAIAWMQANPFGASSADGVDRSLVMACLALPHLERIQRNWLAVRNAEHARVSPRLVDERVNGRP